ncbi:MAG: hypothetical protein JWM48_3044 [Mycobacterium sp.]|nr:hypothetical protein [Mycobacterium sp.]MCW2746494.1 hypothetical protein [Mycobacterium sp.]
MSPTAANAEGQRGLAERLGVSEGALVQSLGSTDGVDTDLLTDVVARSGNELVPEDSDDVVDMVLLWWREDDGDLVDALVDARRQLGESGVLWLLTPKAGREGHVEPSDVREAVPIAGLAQTSSIAAAPEWSGLRLAAPKSQRKGR